MRMAQRVMRLWEAALAEDMALSSASDVAQRDAEGAHHRDHEDEADELEHEGIGGAAVPVEHRELGFDRLGEPEAGTPAEQHRHDIGTGGEHEGDDAARGDAGLGMGDHDLAMHPEPGSAEVARRLDLV